jgi:poly(3-hydroxybutyrate) depolymerase
MRLLFTIATGISCLAATAPRADCVPQAVSFADIQRTYTLCTPNEVKAASPVLLLLHGSGSNGAYIASLWKDFAARKGIILVAPDSRRDDGWHLKEDGPDFLHTVVDDVQTRYATDRRRLYLFGQSGGAVYALTLAMLESQYFAAVAVHAGGWRSPEEFKVMQLARRKIPLKIMVGDRDEYFSLSSEHRTQDGLKAQGFSSELEIVAGQHHGFTPEIAPATEESAWRFLSPVALGENPVFIDYPQFGN